jgi:hypothetical protein
LPQTQPSFNVLGGTRWYVTTYTTPASQWLTRPLTMRGVLRRQKRAKPLQHCLREAREAATKSTACSAWYPIKPRDGIRLHAMFDAIEPTTAPVRHRGMASRYQSITAATASTIAASERLFGASVAVPNSSGHRGDILRYVLRALYGADYRKRGARLLGVSERDLSEMLCHGRRVSRRIVDRLESAAADRKRHRHGELRALAGAVASAFEAETGAIALTDELLPLLARMASAAANTHNPHSSETGRFVPRRQGKAPLISELPRAAKKRGKVR